MSEPKIVSFIRCCSMKKGTKDLIELLSEGVDVNEIGSDGSTALISACRFNKDPAVVRFLIDHGADVRKQGRDGETALIALGRSPATPDAFEQMLQTLLSNGSDILAKDNYGHNILHYAAYNRFNYDIIPVCLKYGANPNLPDNNGITAVEMICRFSAKPDYVKSCVMTASDVYPLFVAFILNPKMLSCSGDWNQDYIDDCFRLFIQHGLDINRQDYIGNTALMYFCQTYAKDFPVGSNSGFGKILFQKPDLDAAAKIIRQMIKFGADIKLKNRYGQTVLDLCAKKEPLLAALQTA